MEEANYAADGFNVGLTVVFIILNGFFVAAEFALVKLTKSKIKTMIREKQPFAETVMWIFKRQNMALSACQLGITMASLALGWIGEPAIAHLITPTIESFGIQSANIIHGIAFTIAFTIITALHIVIGEQVPKIYAIRRPSPVMQSTAMILKGFYMILYPFMYVLNGITNIFLRWLGITESDEHDTPLNEEEIRASLGIAYAKGELSKTEHRLLNAVFRFDDEVARKIMKPRNDVEFLDAENSFSENLEFAKRSSHSRFPMCEGSLDKIIGVIHIRDLMGHEKGAEVDLAQYARPPLLIPENMLIGKLMQEFRQVKQHFAFVQDEHGTTVGIVTLEDVLEELVGNVQDEFDLETETILEHGAGKYLIEGDVSIDDLNMKFDLSLQSEDAGTISGLIVENIGHKLVANEVVGLDDGVEARILEIDGIRVTKLELVISKSEENSV